MRILGLDLSTVSTGFAIINEGQLVRTGKIVPITTDVMSRIFEISDTIATGLAQEYFDKVIIEDTFYGGNHLTLKLLNKLAGAVYFVLMNNGHKVQFVMPTEARKIFGLLPKSKKNHIVKAVNRMFNTNFTLIDNDITDSVVLAFFGWSQHINPTQNFNKSSQDFYKKTITTRLKTPNIKKKNKK